MALRCRGLLAPTQYCSPWVSFRSTPALAARALGFTDVLTREGVIISMDGVDVRWTIVAQREVRGRVPEGLRQHGRIDVGWAQYFAFYNAQRPHQSPSYQTPDQVYRDGIGGGAMFADRFGDDIETPQERSMTGQRRAAEEVEMGTA